MTGQKFILFLPLYREFISKSQKGHRLRYPGRKMTKGTIQQYWFVYQLLEEFEAQTQAPLRVLLYKGTSTRILTSEKKYWQRFLKHFLDFLYNDKKHKDAYVDAVLKNVRTCFNYIINEKHLPIFSFHKTFKVKSEPIEPIILSPNQLQFLIHNMEFHKRLPAPLQRTKDIFIFGCTVALRYSDLMALERKNLVPTDKGFSLILRTQKTGTPVQIPLPSYLIDIIMKYKRARSKHLLPRLSSTNINLQVKELCSLAGWNYALPKLRHRRGKVVELRSDDGATLTFANQVTAHTMRRTAITTLLIMGVPELVVRRISGHAPGSKEFYKYIVVAQEYLNKHLIDAYEKLAENAEKSVDLFKI